MDWNLYASYIKAGGSTEREEILQDTKDYFEENAVNNPSYHDDIVYNQNARRRFLIQRTESYNKVKITAFPGEELYSGDLLQCGDETLLVTGTFLLNPLQTVGIAWICNITLRFQNGTSNVIEIPAALDDGTYSTTVGMEKNIQYLNKKLRVYVPYNDDTSKIYIDKRFALETLGDKRQNLQLVVYKVAGINHSSVSFGKGSHLLELTLDSDNYSPSKDNLKMMICDYIPPVVIPEPTQKLKCSIKGRPKLFLGESRVYTPLFYDKDGKEIVVEPKWSVKSSAGITSEEFDEKIRLSASEDENLIGETATIILSDKDGLYEPFSLEVGVVV